MCAYLPSRTDSDTSKLASFAPMDPAGRVAVVTGAGGGIGGALVRALVSSGAAAVIATDVEAPLGFAAPVMARPLDVTDDEATRQVVADIETSVGPVALWFANAGVAGGGGPEKPDSV